MKFDMAFWDSLEKLVQDCGIVIDRAAGTAHPRYPDFIYPIDYGYLEGTSAMDGGGIDVWRGTDPAQRVVGILCTLDLMMRDSEVKVLIGCTEDEIQTIYRAQNEVCMHALLVRRP